MKKLMRKLMVLGMLAVMSVGAFGQKPKDNKRPDKEPEKVISRDKKQPPPPPQNSNRPKPDNKKK
jgi:hypothetical protein